jgi:hypothetical protein
MKMNWGHGIVIGFVLFASFVFTLIFKMVSSGNDIVKKSYYKSGTEINQEIHVVQASQPIREGFILSYKEGSGQIQIGFSTNVPKPEGKIELTCLSSDLGDQVENLQLEKKSSSWTQTISLLRPVPGNWLCEIRGKSGEKDFIIKDSFRIYGPGLAQNKNP